MNHGGKIHIFLFKQDSFASLRIEDNGRGIPQNIIETLGTRGVSFEKKEGSGLGLFHAKQTVESWGGSLSIESTLGKGSTVILNIPFCTPPAWFLPKIELEPGTHVLILDDDISIHQIWEKRFAGILEQDPSIQLSHCSTSADFETKFLSLPERSKILLLVDYELKGEPVTGLQMIEKLKVQSQSILVTSRFEEAPIKAKVQELSFKLLPKNLAATVPIHVADRNT